MLDCISDEAILELVREHPELAAAYIFELTHRDYGRERALVAQAKVISETKKAA